MPKTRPPAAVSLSPPWTYGRVEEDVILKWTRLLKNAGKKESLRKLFQRSAKPGDVPRISQSEIKRENRRYSLIFIREISLGHFPSESKCSIGKDFLSHYKFSLSLRVSVDLGRGCQWREGTRIIFSRPPWPRKRFPWDKPWIMLKTWKHASIGRDRLMMRIPRVGGEGLRLNETIFIQDKEMNS